VDRAGFDAAMAEQRQRARSAARAARAGDESSYRALIDAEGPTLFVGRDSEHYEVPARVVGVLAGAEPGAFEVFLDQTPFYAEGGGQVGDTGTIVTETGIAEIYDTVYAVPGLIAHRARVDGELAVGQDALAAIDGERREAIRRNHTATHLLHAALRSVLGEHVRQQGSSVTAERLRFDFSHHAQPTDEELAAVFAMANEAVLTGAAVETTETSLEEAQRMGAIAFFGDKYGPSVRVVQSGAGSLEFCGGTHVDSLGQIGPILLESEGSTGANTRRIFALTGRGALARIAEREHLVSAAASLVKAEPESVVEAIERVLVRQREAEKELSRLRQQSSVAVAAELAAAAVEAAGAAGAAGSGSAVVVARQDGLDGKALQTMAQAVARHDGIRAAVLGGSPDGEKVAIAAATGGDPDATGLVRALGAIVGGGGGGSSEVALAGGKDPARLDEALAEARRLLSE
jgi:alanyl-tRNA synthetase